MKATLWLWSLVTTMLCATQSIYASPVPDFQYTDSRAFQDNYFSPKRTKPSLSIVNPLDVLRQRLLLEIARRQMRENTKQVEINRAILKNVGKRGNELDYYDFDRLQPQRQQPLFLQQEQHQDQEKLPNENNPNPRNNDDDYQIKYVYSLYKNSLKNI